MVLKGFENIIYIQNKQVKTLLIYILLMYNIPNELKATKENKQKNKEIY